jgi:hypothetical protein
MKIFLKSIVIRLLRPIISQDSTGKELFIAVNWASWNILDGKPWKCLDLIQLLQGGVRVLRCKKQNMRRRCSPALFQSRFSASDALSMSLTPSGVLKHSYLFNPH